jgi:hypothetical protein
MFLSDDDAPGSGVPQAARASSHAKLAVEPVIPEWADPAIARATGVYVSTHPTSLAKSLTADATHACEQAFRILFEVRGNVHFNLMFYLRSIVEDWNEEVWIRYRCTWCTGHRGAVNC